MLTNATFLKGLAIQATDGTIGKVDDLYFDDENWAIRYLTVDTGHWLEGRQVLISPHSVTYVDWDARRLDVSITKGQVEKSPDVDTHQPISRQHESEYFGYYGYPYYWGGPYLWGPDYYPSGMIPGPNSLSKANPQAIKGADSHLRSSKAITGYHVEASDGEIGHLDGFIVDDKDWAIRYIEIATRDWLPGKKVLLSPEWIDRVSWADTNVYVGLSKQAIKSAPEYIVSRPLTRELETELHDHYGRPPYWSHIREHAIGFALST
jgi:hypothetical protein